MSYINETVNVNAFYFAGRNMRMFPRQIELGNEGPACHTHNITRSEVNMGERKRLDSTRSSQSYAETKLSVCSRTYTDQDCELMGRTSITFQDGLQYIVCKGSRAVKFFDMSDGQKTYRLRQEDDIWTLIGTK